MAELRVGAGDGQPIDAGWSGHDGSDWFVLIAARGGVVGAVPACAAACLDPAPWRYALRTNDATVVCHTARPSMISSFHTIESDRRQGRAAFAHSDTP